VRGHFKVWRESRADVINHIYCDESRQSAEQFMVLGGIVIPDDRLVAIHQTLQEYRREEHMRAELKWTKVTKKYLRKYKAFVDHFFALNTRDCAHFHSLILDSHQFNHRKFNEGDKDLGYYKFLYQLLLHSFGKQYCKNKRGEECKLVVHPDQRNSKYPLDRLKTTLNFSMAKKFGFKSNPFVSIEAQDSKEADLAQLNDILIGAVGFHKNGIDLIAGAAQGKIDLASYIRQKSGLRSLTDSTSLGWNRFEIWNFKLQK
jgi:hypothetical protein